MNIFSFEGRIGRGTYFLWMLAFSISMLAFSFLYPLFMDVEDAVAVSKLLGVVIGVLCIFPSVRRMHDLNKSGWFFLFGFVPILNIVLSFFLLLMKGTDGSNDYGESPNKSCSGGVAVNVKSPAVPESDKRVSVEVNEDALYEQVAEEIESDHLVRGVWIRAFAEADGDENRAKAIYIKTRVAQLLEQGRERVAERDWAVKEKFKTEQKKIIRYFLRHVCLAFYPSHYHS